MKNLFLFPVSCFVFITISTTMNAQTAVKQKVEVPLVENAYETTVAPANPMAAFRNINIRAVRHFKTTYENIDNEKWDVIPEGYSARVVNDGIVYRVTYDKKGKWIHTILRYDETKLKQEIRAQVRGSYSNYSIYLIEEIEEPRMPVTYLVHLEDKISLKNIRIRNREMEVVEDIKKL